VDPAEVLLMVTCLVIIAQKMCVCKLWEWNPLAGGADHFRHQLGRLPPGAGRRDWSTAKAIRLGGGWTGEARTVRRPVRRLGRRRGAEEADRRSASDAAWQRGDAHLLQNAPDYPPYKVDDDCLQELRWMYGGRDL
jgi:hypothetical protein